MKSMPVTLSASFDDDTAALARDIAHREHRSVSNLIANAVAVFTDMPRDLRDALLELRAAGDRTATKAIAHEMIALAARARFDLASRHLAADAAPPSGIAAAGDMELFEAATELVRAGAPGGV